MKLHLFEPPCGPRWSRALLPFVFALLATTPALALEWGTERWGEQPWGEWLADIPLLPQGGAALLLIAFLAAARWLLVARRSRTRQPALRS
jgi:hypothetical protein